jgi:hypothetical protein
MQQTADSAPRRKLSDIFSRIGAYMTTYGLFIRIRSMAEHGAAPPPGYLGVLRIVSARAPSAG